jgi:hypothetical protein
MGENENACKRLVQKLKWRAFPDIMEIINVRVQEKGEKLVNKA